MKRIIFFVFTLFILAGCGSKSESSQKSEALPNDSGSVRIALQPTLECLPFMVAEENGLFDSCGVKVTLEVFNSQADCDTAVALHHADGMISDVVRTAFWERKYKRKLKYVTWTNTHFMLISSKKSRVKDLQHMTDRLMAVTRYSVTDVLADSAIIRAGKSPEEMFKVQINDQEIRLNMLLENKMDAAFLQHPYAAEAVSKGGNVIMHGGKSCAGMLVFEQSADSMLINKILKAYDDACTRLNDKGVVCFASILEKYTHKDVRKWAKHLEKENFRKSQCVDERFIENARKWVEAN